MYQILLVDDEALVREAISEKMQWADLGYELAGCCEDGKEALEFVRKHPVDLVLTDICMPYMDGLDLCECLMNEFPRMEIIILSGYDEFEYAKRALQYHVTEYILKPVTSLELSEFLIRLKETMDKQREQEKKTSEITAAYHKNRLLIRSNTLRNLVEGNRSQKENEEELRAWGIELTKESFRVAIVSINLFEASSALDEKTKQESGLISFIVYNITNEIVAKYQAGEVCQGEGLKTLILFTTNKPHEFMGTVAEIAEEILAQVKRLAGLEITIVIGKYVTLPGDIYKSYEDAKQAADYRYIIESPLIDMEQREMTTSKRFHKEEEMEPLFLLVKTGEREQLKKQLEIIKQNIRKTVPEKSKAVFYLQYAVNQIGEILNTADRECHELYLEKEQVSARLASAFGLEEAVALLADYCLRVMNQLEVSKNQGGKKYAVLALDYIEKNYSDPTINLNSICAYLNMSTSRFSCIFKTITGETFMEVLIRTRMEKAKELLEHTDLKNYEIAERVGFGDPHYFSVSFKKRIGMTPKKYAKMWERKEKKQQIERI